jgi:hypothetical protein
LTDLTCASKGHHAKTISKRGSVSQKPQIGIMSKEQMLNDSLHQSAITAGQWHSERSTDDTARVQTEFLQFGGGVME